MTKSIKKKRELAPKKLGEKMVKPKAENKKIAPKLHQPRAKQGTQASWVGTGKKALPASKLHTKPEPLSQPNQALAALEKQDWRFELKDHGQQGLMQGGQLLARAEALAQTPLAQPEQRRLAQFRQRQQAKWEQAKKLHEFYNGLNLEVKQGTELHHLRFIGGRLHLCSVPQPITDAINALPNLTPNAQNEMHTQANLVTQWQNQFSNYLLKNAFVGSVPPALSTLWQMFQNAHTLPSQIGRRNNNTLNQEIAHNLPYPDENNQTQYATVGRQTTAIALAYPNGKKPSRSNPKANKLSKRLAQKKVRRFRITDQKGIEKKMGRAISDVIFKGKAAVNKPLGGGIAKKKKAMFALQGATLGGTRRMQKVLDHFKLKDLNDFTTQYTTPADRLNAINQANQTNQKQSSFYDMAHLQASELWGSGREENWTPFAYKKNQVDMKANEDFLAHYLLQNHVIWYQVTATYPNQPNPSNDPESYLATQVHYQAYQMKLNTVAPGTYPTQANLWLQTTVHYNFPNPIISNQRSNGGPI